MRPQSPASDPAGNGLLQRLQGVPWRLLPSQSGSGAWQMALDAGLLDSAAAGRIPPTLRFYTWEPPTVSLGRFQAPDGIDLAYARDRGWGVVRRPTGGRAVLHHLELTYSLVLPPGLVGGAGVRTSYRVLTAALASGLRTFTGRDAAPPRPDASWPAGSSRAANCFALAGEWDTLVGTGKLVGSAQARRDGALLQHGSILLDAEPGAWAALFGDPGRLVTLRDLLGQAPSPERVSAAIEAAFENLGVRLEPGELARRERYAARAAAVEARI